LTKSIHINSFVDITGSLISHFFFLQNTPFGNISVIYATFSYILPVRETFLFFPVDLIILFLQGNLLCYCRLTYFKNACKCMKFKEKVMQK